MPQETSHEPDALTCERSITRKFHQLFLCMVVGVGAFAASPLWLGPIIAQAAALHAQFGGYLAAHPVGTWGTLLGLSLGVTYSLGLYLLLEKNERFAGRPARRLAMLSVLSVLSLSYLLLESAAPKLPVSWWVDYLTTRVALDAPVEQLNLVFEGLYALANLAGVLLLSTAILAFMVLTCASPKQIEAD